MRSAVILGLAALVLVGCGGDDEQEAAGKRAPSNAAGRTSGTARGPGFEVGVPVGFSQGADRGPVVLTLIGKVDRRSGFPQNITVARTRAPAGTSVEQVRRSIRAQTEAQGARDITALPDRTIDREPAIGVTYRRPGPGGGELTQRTYAVVHGSSLFTVASSTSGGSASGEQVLETVLASWRWR